MKSRISRDVDLVIGFISGIIFSNAVGAIIQGQFTIAFLSFVAVGLAISLKRFFDWDVEG